MTDLKVFKNEKFGELRVLVINKKEYFPAAEVAKLLGYKNVHDALIKHCKDDGVVFHEVIDTMGRVQNKKFINEGNLYRLIVKSKLPQAEIFEKWVFEEVLPTIRKTGMYITDNVWEQIVSNPEQLGKLIIDYGKLKKENKQLEEDNNNLKAKNLEQKPKVDYYDKVLTSEGKMNISEIAKEYGMTGQQLNELLRTYKIQYKQGGKWYLYSQYAKYGYTTYVTTISNNNVVYTHMKWTHKGKKFIYDFLKEKGILPKVNNI